jgi:putative redox protein
MQALLLACAACSGADAVVILQKMRVQLSALEVEVEGTRRDEEPRRYVAVRFRFRLAGAGLDRAKAERAVSLSLEKYCSVVHSLAPDVDVAHDIEIA